ncbi:MAG TPA: hypothetical protein VHX68_00255 [Planctomycetaceae bacterium]|jgi:hypothetical protein|nr:hypothetical protein [Planctomycetaceae bacterium]
MFGLPDGTSKTVDITVRLVPDPGNAGVATAIVEQIEEINSSATEVFTSIAKLSDDTASKVERTWTSLAEKLARKWEEVGEKAAAAQEAANSKIERITQKTVRTVVSVHEEAASRTATAHETAISRIETSYTHLEHKIREQESEHENLARTAIDAAGHVVGAVSQINDGLAKAGLISEENSKKFAEMIEPVKGVIDVFDGVATIIETTVKFTNAWKVALEAAKAEESAILVIEKLRGATGVGGAAGAGIGGAAAAPAAFGILPAAVSYGVIAAGAVATGAIGYDAWQMAHGKRALGAATMEHWFGVPTGEVNQEEARGRMQRAQGLLHNEAAAQSSRERLAARRYSLAAGNPAQERAVAQQESADAAKRLKEVAADRAAWQKSGGQDTAELPAMKQRELNAYNQAEQAQQKILDLDRKRTEELRQQRDRQADIVKGYEQQVEAAKQLVAEEKKRTQSRQADFGRLSRTDRNQLLLASDRIKSGKAKEGDYRLLDRFGYGKAKADEFFANRLSKREKDTLGYLEPDGRAQAMANLGKTQVAYGAANVGLAVINSQYKGANQNAAADPSALGVTNKRQDDVGAQHKNPSAPNAETANAAAHKFSHSFEEAFVTSLIPAMSGLCQRMAALINNAGNLS